MAFYLKNLNPTFVTVTVSGGELTLRPGKIVGPLDDKDMTPDVIAKANRRIINVIVPAKTAAKESQIEPESNVDPEDTDDVETEEY